jgi:hypothetical protein
MSALTGDLSQISGIFAGLAAIVAVLFFGTGTSRVSTFVIDGTIHRSSFRLRDSAAAQQVNDQNQERNHQEQMNQASSYVQCETEEPEN